MTFMLPWTIIKSCPLQMKLQIYENLILLSLRNIVINHQSYHDITSFMNLTIFTLYKILKAFIISVNIQIMKWHNKDPGSKNLPPPWAMAHVDPCVNTTLVGDLGTGASE